MGLNNETLCQLVDGSQVWEKKATNELRGRFCKTWWSCGTDPAIVKQTNAVGYTVTGRLIGGAEIGW